MLRFHGSLDKRTHEQIGYNSRLDELQAAVLRVQLPHLDEWAEGRRRAAREYEQAGLGALASLPSAGAWIRARLAPVRAAPRRRRPPAGRASSVRDRLPQLLHAAVHRQPAMRAWGERAQLPATEELARTNLAVPMSPLLSRAQAEEVVAAARAA